MFTNNRLICFIGKRCNKLPKLFEDKQERFDNILSSVKGEKLYSVSVLLGSKSFRKSFGLLSKSMASSGEDGSKDVPVGKATLVMGDEGESHHSRDAPCRDNDS